MTWPNHECPPGGPMAVEHLEYIRMKAHEELAPGSPLLQRVCDAINACEMGPNGHCLPSGAPPGIAPHCQKVLWARYLACNSDWGACATELEHGI